MNNDRSPPPPPPPPPNVYVDELTGKTTDAPPVPWPPADAPPPNPRKEVSGD